MNIITESLILKRDFYSEKGASLEVIKKAEDDIGVKFANDYKECLMKYGAVSCSGHDLTGVSSNKNLDVVNITLLNRKKNPKVNNKFYVVEETHLDGIVVWQTTNGEIFQTEYKEEPVKIYNSLVEYIESFT